jgi:hypothetical protein
MASLLSSKPRETADRSDISLTTTRPQQGRGIDRRLASIPGGPRHGWVLLAAGGALATALAGWIIVAGLAVVGWVAAGPGDIGQTLRIGTRLWLLTNGGSIRLAGLSLTVVPIGVSLLFSYMISRFARSAARYVRRSRDVGEQRLRYAMATAAVMTGCYAVAICAAGSASGAIGGRLVLGAVLIPACGSLWGSCREFKIRVLARWPAWVRPVPYAVAAAAALLLVGGLAVLVTGVWTHADRVGQLAGGLGAGAVGGVALWAAQLAFLPNAVIWSASYALGAGFTLGPHTVVSPAEVNLGLLPPVPVLGALPSGGVGDWSDLLWLAVGLLAGGAAAWQVLRRRLGARFDETALVGGLAGVVAALVFVVVGWVAVGDLGDHRLSDVGPRLKQLLILAVTLLGLSGMFFGLVFGLLRRLRGRRSTADGEPESGDT